MGNLPATTMTGFGARWIRFGIKINWKKCGYRGGRLGGFGTDADGELSGRSGLLARSPCASDWPYRLQGSLDCTLAQPVGAVVTGGSLPPESAPNLFDGLGVLPGVTSRFADIRDVSAVQTAVAAAEPEGIHIAGQALVPLSYREPLQTFAANVIGTAHVLEALRTVDTLRAVLVVTSDKTY